MESKEWKKVLDDAFATDDDPVRSLQQALGKRAR